MNAATKQRIRRALRKYRKKNVLTLRQMGDRVGCDGAAILRYEQGKNVPGIGRLMAIADVIGIPIDELVNGSK